MFNITGISSASSVFNMGFGIVPYETREWFDWLFKAVYDITQRLNVRGPSVIISDFDEQLRNAAKAQFPFTQILICIFHMNKNIILQLGRKFVTDKDQIPSTTADDEAEAEEQIASIPIDALTAENGRFIRDLNNSRRFDDDFPPPILPNRIPRTREGMLLC